MNAYESGAAAPAMARALCLVEWGKDVEGWDGKLWACCPECEGAEPGQNDDDDPKDLGHKAGCTLDAALTAAGLDAAEREAVRKAGR